MSEKDFTRKRKMPFVQLVYFIISTLKHSLQKELTLFMGKLKCGAITKSAFCQQRVKLKPEAFIELNELLVNEFYTDNETKTYLGFRLLSIDGSTIELPSTPEVIKEYGVNNAQNMVPIAKVSALYDVMNNITLEGKIAPNRASEYDLAIDFIKKATPGDLILLDRGYGARWLFCLLLQSGIEFAVRIQKQFGEDIDSFWNEKINDKIIEIVELPDKSEERIKELKIEFHPFKLRLVKFKLKNGETEVLATSLLDKQKHSFKVLKEMYSLRWGIEENYKHLKTHLEIGNFTGYSPSIIKQDFYANLFIANLQALIIRDAQMELNESTKNRKHEYKVNRNLSLGFMKEKIVDILLNKKNSYEELRKLFLIEPVPIRKNRSFPREGQRHKRKYYINQKRGI